MAEGVYRKVYKDMNKGVATLFESFILRSAFDEALEFIEVCTDIIPPPSVINEIIFTIVKNSDTKTAYKATNYLQNVLLVLPKDKKYDFTTALLDKTHAFPDVWSVFTHFVMSSFNYHHIAEIETYDSCLEFVKGPNCDILIYLYVKVFEVCCPVKSIIFQHHPENRLSTLLAWINQFYKCNVEQVGTFRHLHKLLDLIVECEVLHSEIESISSSVALNKAPLCNITALILNSCKDAFSSFENQQKFFINSSLPYLSLKICQYSLHKMIYKDKEPLSENTSPMTLKSMMNDYFLEKSKPEPKNKTKPLSKSTKKSTPQKNQRKFSKGPTLGDTILHEFCRLSRPADLLDVLLRNKNIDINVKNNAGNTPLHVAALASSFYCVKFLIEDSINPVDFKATDAEGRTPLYCAIHVNACDIVKLLISRGGTELLKCLDNAGDKPINYATSKEMKQLLQEYESKLTPCDDESSAISTSVRPAPFLMKEEYSRYVYTLRALLLKYLEVFNLQRAKDSCAKVLPHDTKDCCHYKASLAGTWCSDDYSVFDKIPEAINNVIQYLKSIENGFSIEDEISELADFLVLLET